MKKKQVSDTVRKSESPDQYFRQLMAYGQSVRIPRQAAESVANRYDGAFDEFSTAHSLTVGTDQFGQPEYFQHELYKALFDEYQKARIQIPGSIH